MLWNKIIAVTELQRNFRNVLDDVVEQKASYILTRTAREFPAVVLTGPRLSLVELWPALLRGGYPDWRLNPDAMLGCGPAGWRATAAGQST